MAQVARVGIRPRVLHRQREGVVARLPVHVTIRLRRGIPTLRQPRFVRRFRSSLSEACVRHGFRVVHYSIQRDHVHLLIEAQSNHSIRLRDEECRCAHRQLANPALPAQRQSARRSLSLASVTHALEVHRALRYVLLNHRHHTARRRIPKRLTVHPPLNPIRPVQAAGSMAGARPLHHRTSPMSAK
jgi:hypothetical protein